MFPTHADESSEEDEELYNFPGIKNGNIWIKRIEIILKSGIHAFS